MMHCVEATLEPVRQCLLHASAENEHARYELANALLKIQEGGLTVVNDPYRAEVQVTSRQGFRLQITVTKRQPDELIQALDALLPWLHSNGYVP